MPSPIRPIRFTLVITLLFVLLTAATIGRAAGLPHLRQLAQHADVTALIVRLGDMHTIAALNPDKRLRPASVSKLFAASDALQQLGPNHRFISKFTTHGRLNNGVLQGNLIFVGGGAPALDNPHLHQLILRLRDRGVRKVNGNLIVDQGLWGPVPCSTKDRCKAQKRASHSYSAPLSSAGINFGTIHVTLYPAATPGHRVRAVLHPANIPGYRFDNQVKTVARGGRAGVVAWRTYDGKFSTLHLRGSLPVGYGAYDFHRAVTGAALETARVLSAMFANAGIRISGVIKTRSGNTANEGVTLAKISSPTLAEQLIPMLAYSNNYMADTLTLDTAADDHFPTPISLPHAAKVLEAFSAQANQFAYPGRSTGHASFDSGSGLSLGNAISARDLVSLLDYMYHQPDLFPSFYGSLPVPVYAPSRTLKRGNIDFETRLVAKTGTLTEPVTVRALAGYLRLSNGGFAAYGIIINGTQDNPSLTYKQTVIAYQNDLEAILAKY